jgi:hypothetical protein
VDEVIKTYSRNQITSLSQFRSFGGTLYVNDKEVTLGSTRIQPDDRVKILVPKELSGEGGDPGNGNNGGEDSGGGGSAGDGPAPDAPGSAGGEDSAAAPGNPEANQPV